MSNLQHLVKKPHLVHKRFQLPKSCSVKSFVLREIDGEDERDVAMWMTTRGDSDYSIAIMEEQLRVAIVAVDDEPVQQPYTGMNKWNSKTRKLLLEGWGALNSLDQDEVATFLGAARNLNDDESQSLAAEILDEKEIQRIRNEEA